jgi:hypothetical protein
MLNEHSAAAKAELQRHVKEIRMFPASDGDSWCYEVDGTWDLLGLEPDLDRRRRVDDERLRMVAGA